MLAVLGLMFLGFDPSVLTIPPEMMVVPELPKEWTVEEMKTLATSTAAKYGLTNNQTTRLLNVINCESRWVATSTSPTGDFGVVQINKRFHPEVTMEQAFDPAWSIEWMIKHWANGRYSMWVCYTILYG